MIQITIEQNRNRNAMSDRFPSHGDEQPCYICGRPCKPGSGYWLHVIDGGFCALHPSSESDYQSDNADLGFQPIGTACLKKHPELKGFAVK